MSFLSNNNSEFLSARITQKGRNSIAKGNFVISYFQIGDSEFDYTTPFTGLTDHEIYNLKLKMSTKNKKPLKNSK